MTEMPKVRIVCRPSIFDNKLRFIPESDHIAQLKWIRYECRRRLEDEDPLIRQLTEAIGDE